MKNINSEILVIGGGATGAGIARDAAMRGFKTVLVERNDLAQGTTGRYHGLLHSGGRYVVKDPKAAAECIEENRILRKIMPFCIEDTGGFFVTTPWDDPEFAELFLQGCHNSGVPVEEISISQMLLEEPLLNPDISRCFRVPDGSSDSWLATDANAESARQYQAKILPYHEVTGLEQVDGRVVGARCRDRVTGEDLIIHADIVINASGAWVGKIANMVGIEVQVVPGKGTMVAVNHRILNTVVNRCKRPSDADIIVPTHTVAVIGTTDISVKDPDHYDIQPWEVDLMIKEGAKLVPGLEQMRILRAWAGVRPLYQEKVTAEGNRNISRAYVLLDHETRDGVPGLLTITGGKWTTYRAMAEATVDAACKKLGVTRPCTTHLEVLPEPPYTRRRAVDYTPPEPARRVAGDGNGNGQDSNQGLRVQQKDQDRPPVSRVSLYAYQPDPSPDALDLTRGQGPATSGGQEGGYHEMSGRLAAVEADYAYGSLVCECELATVEDVTRSIIRGNSRTIDDIRRDVRLGMGPCQGGFCTVRVAGLLQKLRQPPVEETNAALRDFLQERWKGLMPVLWGQQMRQERLDELIYLSILNADHLPGPAGTPLGPEMYTTPSTVVPEGRRTLAMDSDDLPSRLQSSSRPPASSGARSVDTVVVGAGLAGLTAAWQLAKSGERVRVVSKGWGANYWHAGCVDVLGYYPFDQINPLESPLQGLEKLIEAEPEHPYALAGIDTIQAALDAFQNLCIQAGYPMHGSLDKNWLLPTSVGAIRPTCLAPETMVSGDVRSLEPVLIVGFKGYMDFYPDLIAANLTIQGIPARAVTITLPIIQNRTFTQNRELAWLFEQPEYRAAIAAAIRPHLAGAVKVGFPAVLGINQPLTVLQDLQSLLGMPVFEIPSLPASIPGIRLTNLLIQVIQQLGGRVFDAMQAVGSEVQDGRIVNVLTEAAARRKAHRANNYLLATGGILGGGIVTSPDNRVREVIMDLPIPAPADRTEWVGPQFLIERGHPIFRTGIRVNKDFQTLGDHDQLAYENVFAAGTGLSGGEYIRERSYDGVAIVTGYAAAQKISTQSEQGLVKDRIERGDLNG